MEITFKPPKQVLTPTGGFLEGYTHSLNPYIGCVYACSYCYVRQMPVAMFRKAAWGTWLQVKQDAALQLRREISKAKKKGAVTIFMSSSTDPYQPMEHKARITRSLLEVLADDPPKFLFLQTRGPLVVRDVDLLLRLKDRLLVSVTIETDLESIRKAFTPAAPPIAARLKAIRALVDAGLPVQVAVAPVLPFSDDFPNLLASMVDRICIDDFTGDGSGGKRTDRLRVREIYEELSVEAWYGLGAREKAMGRLLGAFAPAQIRTGQDGFLP